MDDEIAYCCGRVTPSPLPQRTTIPTKRMTVLGLGCIPLKANGLELSSGWCFLFLLLVTVVNFFLVTERNAVNAKCWRPHHLEN
jgi:hypothetical protein